MDYEKILQLQEEFLNNIDDETFLKEYEAVEHHIGIPIEEYLELNMADEIVPKQ
jgi:hypothetical protein